MVDLPTLITLALTAFNFDGTVFPPQAKLINNTCFDYIIVGGGTAGCVLAKNLVEDRNSSVLVLEAGGNPTAIAMAPGLFFALPGTEVDYGYESTYDAYAAGAQGYKTRLTSGHVLGGSSVLNHLLYVTAVAKDYNTWADITGDDSWNYTNLLPYFKQSQNLKDQAIAAEDSDYYGFNGPIGLSRLVSKDETVIGFLNAQAEVGNPTMLDLNSKKNTGYAQPLYTIARDYQNATGGIRQTPAYSYLNLVKDYSNLHISKETRVKKIIFENKTAVGVEAVYKGHTYTLCANKEVILCAGAFNTPQILQMSGVGPTDHLESLGIEVIADLPVGDNLRIPSAVVIVTKTKNHYIPINFPDLAPVLQPTKLPFPVILGSGAWNKSSNVPNHQSYNLILPHDTPFLLIACTLVYGYSLEICTYLQKQIVFRDAIHSVLVNLEAKSTGTVRLNSTDPFDKPVITTGFYNNTEDLDNFVTSIRDFISIVDSPSYQKLGAEVVGVDFDECAHLEYDTDDFWKCYILNRSLSPFLYSGTCAMGTVVDGDLKIKGLKNIRVVDASVMPELMHGALNAAVIVLAEKAADKIKEDSY